MLDLLHLPFGKLEPTPSDSRHQGRGKGEQMDRTPGQETHNQKLILREGSVGRMQRYIDRWIDRHVWIDRKERARETDRLICVFGELRTIS